MLLYKEMQLKKKPFHDMIFTEVTNIYLCCSIG